MSVTITPGACSRSSRARATLSGRSNSTFSDNEWPVNTGTRTHVPDTASPGMSRILRLSLRSFCSSSVSNESVVDERTGVGQHVEGDRPGELGGRRERDGGAVVGEFGGAVDDLASLLVEFVDAGQTATRHGLVGRRDHPDETGLVVQRLEDGHRRHRGAVGVGDDALRRVVGQRTVDLGDDERHLGIHAERGGVVDHDHPGGGELRRELA